MAGIIHPTDPVSGSVTAFAGLGSNLFGRIHFLRTGCQALHSHPAIRIERISSVYETPAHTLTPEETQPPFLNAVLALRTELAPEELLAYFHVIEAQAGRRRTDVSRWAPRTLDLDLLVHGKETHSRPGLRLPHPRMGVRRFVLCPLAELAPDLYVPAPFSASVAELLEVCPDPARPIRTPIRLITLPPVSLFGHNPGTDV
jgi:2-amino-4-hydroxy-6-hydroxymethyldihydropteridine diphosphokinase